MTLSTTDLAGSAGHDVRVGTSSSSSGPGRLKRWTFTAEYKLAILEEEDEPDAQGHGALLRRERLLALHVSEWRKPARLGP